ncbi:MAG: protein kinase [Candidatus Thermoplasmatota archaeon]|nr:protein kinase [Candidatus Thermoplasmatota archaeon]
MGKAVFGETLALTGDCDAVSQVTECVSKKDTMVFVTEKIYEGGFSVTYYCVDEEQNRYVLKMSTSGDAEAERQLAHEDLVLATLDHENIIKVFDYRPHIRSLILYDGGASLFDEVAERRVTMEDAILYCHQMRSAVAYIHDRDVCHLDIKLDNMTITKQKVLKLIDFGLSEKGDMLRILTKVKGSHAYMAPELLDGSRGYFGEEVDSWATGICMFAICTGKTPWTVAHVKDTRFMLFKEGCDHESDAVGFILRQSVIGVDHLPADIVEVINSLVVVDRHQRRTVRDSF